MSSNKRLSVDFLLWGPTELCLLHLAPKCWNLAPKGSETHRRHGTAGASYDICGAHMMHRTCRRSQRTTGGIKLLFCTIYVRLRWETALPAALLRILTPQGCDLDILTSVTHVRHTSHTTATWCSLVINSEVDPRWSVITLVGRFFFWQKVRIFSYSAHTQTQTHTHRIRSWIC